MSQKVFKIEEINESKCGCFGKTSTKFVSLYVECSRLKERKCELPVSEKKKKKSGKHYTLS